MLVGSGVVWAQTLPFDRPPRASIGVLDGPAEEVFGRIVDVGLGPVGDVFVLDGLAHELRWFSPDGEFLARVGGNGQGPGEFGAPFALDVDSAGFVHVLDPRNQRISVFEARAGSFRLHDEISQIIGLDLCIVGSRRYVLPYPSLGEGNLIHEVGEDGEVIASFASLEPLPSRSGVEVSGAAWDRLHSSLLVCGGSGLLFLISEIRPRVRAYDENGAELWSTTLPDYLGSKFEEGPVTGSVQRVPEGSNDYVHTATGAAVIGEHLYITLHAGSLSDPEGSFELRALRISDGVEIMRQTSPIRVADGALGRIVGYATHPFPRVLVY